MCLFELVCVRAWAPKYLCMCVSFTWKRPVAPAGTYIISILLPVMS